MAQENSYLDLLHERYSCRAFSDEQLTDEELKTILEAARLSPSARNNQSTRLCVVQSLDGLLKVDECTSCRYGAPTVIIAAFDDHVASHATPDHGPEIGDFGLIDASIVLTNIDNAAANLGLAGCWVGAFDPKKARELFAVPDGYRLVDFYMVGHPMMGPGPMHADRHDLESFVTRESF